MEINIRLDPVNDGAVLMESGVKKGKEGALVIGTNGVYRLIDYKEAESIIGDLSDIGDGGYLGRTPYVVMFNGNKVLQFGECRCFVGSVLVMKDNGRNCLSLLSEDEVQEAVTAFTSRLIRLISDGQEFIAFELM